MENVHCIWDQVLRPISSQLRAHITHQFTKRIAFDIHVKNMQVTWDWKWSAISVVFYTSLLSCLCMQVFEEHVVGKSIILSWEGKKFYARNEIRLNSRKMVFRKSLHWYQVYRYMSPWYFNWYSWIFIFEICNPLYSYNYIHVHYTEMHSSV